MRRPQRSAIWSLVHDERRALLADLESLGAQHWTTPSLCDGWDVHDVLAHLVSDAKATRRGFVIGMVAARFDFDRQNASEVKRERSDDPGRTVAEFRTVLERTSAPPVALPTRLVEALVHGEDIRRPLGISRNYPSAAIGTALEYQVNTTVKFGGGKERASGRRLVASDADFEVGQGPAVRGPAIALLLAISGRPVRPGELTGPGVAGLTHDAPRL